VFLKALRTLVVICIASAISAQVNPQAQGSGSRSGDWNIRALIFTIARASVLHNPRANIFLSEDLQKKPHRLAEGFNPEWSPDGSKIAFAADRGRDGRSEIFTINPDGSGKKQLTQGKDGTGASMPSWSPTGKKIAFVISRESPRGPAIYSMGEDGTNPQFVAEGIDPQWSPDGSRLVFCRGSKGNPTLSSVWVANSDGSEAVAITDDSSVPLTPKWTKDGKIVFASNRNDRWAIYRMNSDGSGLESLLYSKDSDFMWPTISPDGEQLVVVATQLADPHNVRGGARPGINLMDGAKLTIVAVELDGSHRSKTIAEGLHPSVLWGQK